MSEPRSPSRRDFSKALLGASLGTLAPLGSALATPAPGSLDAIARAKGLRVGNAMGRGTTGPRANVRFEDPAYRALMARECSLFVAENETKWQHLQPRPDTFRPEASDEMFAWAKKEGMAIRGHCLVWQTPRWLPDWVNKHDYGANPKAEAERILRTHISQTCKHFSRDVYSWDVVNEAIDPVTGDHRVNVLNSKLGNVEQIDLCFRLAKEHAPNAKLVYNDYMRWDERSAKHRSGVLQLLRDLRKRGTPIDALGLQGHIGYWPDNEATGLGGPAQWRKFLDEATAMDLDLLITEFDVSDKGLPTEVPARDAQVAAIAKEFLDVTLSYTRLREFLFWGMANRQSWLQEWIPRADKTMVRGCPFDEKLQPTPLYTALADAFRAMPQRT
ncbi:Endo-1,4-beta-xylanase Z [Usitatibacter rugosus]|uniref:Beta-xylanase n=1 Tax=Usitatibacter rugosus TaxID=2732067 RepID=A0A6M4GV48_9PROT|nr:endo-1,4-beta-xylanase [Usitatibacter rugosus]QJR11191.1 Endo-1,4-beta-xylanase Z [Usitatibacter rugosus]